MSCGLSQSSMDEAMDPALSPLLGKEGTPRTNNRFTRAHFVALGVLAAFVGAAAMTNTSSVAAPSSLASASPGFSIVVKDPQYPQPSSVVKGVYPWDAVYAPNREHDLTFVSGKSLKGNGGSITWTVSMQTTGDDGALSYETVRSWKANGASSPSQVLATQAGKQHRITAVDEAGNTATATYIAKHIRREVRSLSEDDRDIFLTALATVMATPTEAGRALYGDDFFGGEW